jgi:hypothetical protein
MIGLGWVSAVRSWTRSPDCRWVGRTRRWMQCKSQAGVAATHLEDDEDEIVRDPKQSDAE